MSFTIYHLIYLIVCIAEALIAAQYFGSISDCEGNRGIQLTSYIFSYGIVYLISILSDNFRIGMAVYFAVNFFLGYLIHRLSVRFALFCAGIMAVLCTGSEWMMNGVMRSILVMSGGGQRTMGYDVLTVVLSRMLFLIFMEILILIRSMADSEKEEKYAFGMAALFTASAASCLAVGVFTYIEVKRLISGPTEWMMMCGALAILLANILIYRNAAWSRRLYREYTREQVQLERESARVEYYRMLSERSEEQKILIHDMRNHLNQLDRLIQEQDYIRSASYLRELLNTSAFQPASRICDNEMASMILMHYQEVCRQKNIRFFPDVRSKCLDSLSMQELTALLTNLLDNAVEASEGIPDAFIELRVSQRFRTQIVICMDNSCDRLPRHSEHGLLLTHKADAARHGFGMKSIQRIVKKHSGTVQTSHDAEAKVFHTILFMSISE